MIPGQGPRIALVIDNPYRDLPGLVLVAMRLSAAGATCFLVPFNLRVSELWQLAPDFVLMNYLRSKNQDLVRQLLDVGMQVGVLNTEGAVFYVLPEGAHTKVRPETSQPENHAGAYAVSMAEDAEVRYRIHCFFSWGRRFAEHAVREGWFRPETISVTGVPRLDFYTTPWSDAVRQLSSHVDNYGDTMVLIIGSTRLANPSTGVSPEEEAKGREKLGYSPAFVRTWQEADRRVMCGMADLANNLARRFPAVQFIYRPHPFEAPEAYKKLLERLPNLHLVKQGTLDGWILRARAVIHRNSMASIEAALNGIPVLTPAWLETPMNATLVDSISVACRSSDYLSQLVKTIVDGSYTNPPEIRAALESIMRDWFHQVDGRAHQRVAARILDSLAEDYYTRRSQLTKACQHVYAKDQAHRSKKSTLRGSFYDIVRRGLGFFGRSRQGTQALPKNAWMNSEKYFNESHVQKIADALYRCAQTDPSQCLPMVQVQLARASGAYLQPYDGHSVAITMVRNPWNPGSSERSVPALTSCSQG